MLTDTHAHLDLPQFDDDRQEVIKRASEVGIDAIINPGINIESSRAAIELAASDSLIHAAVGVHPSEVGSFSSATLDELADLAGSPKVVAIGETGLDFFREYHPREEQEEAFRSQIRLAVDMKLPLIIHSRGAEERVLEILKEERGKRVGGVLHCWGGTEKQARHGHDLGFLLGFGGTLTFKNADHLAVASSLPIDWVVLETDAPYLAPVPHRGKRCEPSHVALSAKRLASEGSLTLDDVHRVTTHNAKRLFGLDDTSPTKIAYTIRRSRYLNVTNRCTLACAFCPKFDDPNVKGHDLALTTEPSVNEVLAAVGDPTQWDEVVFCGFGEPTLRLDMMLEVATELKKSGVKRIRLDTDGLANHVYERDVTPRFAGLIDEVSVSMNAPDEVTYAKICRPGKPEGAWSGVLDFIRCVKQHVPSVTATVLAMPSMDIEASRRIAEDELGVSFRVREYDVVG